MRNECPVHDVPGKNKLIWKLILKNTCILFELFKNFFAWFRFWNISDKKSLVRDWDIDFQLFSGRDFVPFILKNIVNFDIFSRLFVMFSVQKYGQHKFWSQKGVYEKMVGVQKNNSKIVGYESRHDDEKVVWKNNDHQKYAINVQWTGEKSMVKSDEKCDLQLLFFEGTNQSETNSQQSSRNHEFKCEEFGTESIELANTFWEKRNYFNVEGLSYVKAGCRIVSKKDGCEKACRNCIFFQTSHKRHTIFVRFLLSHLFPKSIQFLI